MKTLNIALVALVAACLFTACTDKKKLEAAEAQNVELSSELQQTLVAQDSLLSLFNDITDGLTQIKSLEKILATPNLNGETPSKKAQIRADLEAIYATLEDRRTRLDKLERQLKNSSDQNATLTKTIESLRAQISNQENELSGLREQLAQANIVISDLRHNVDSLNTTVESTVQERNVAQQDAVAARDELNLCWYAIGTSKELKNAGILQTGFLRKTKIMESDFDRNYFTRADKRTISEIPVHSKKAKVITNQPKDSYTLDKVDEQYVLKITDPAKFWSISNFLVIETN